MSEEHDETETEEVAQARHRLEKVYAANKAIEQDINKLGAAPRSDIVMMIKLDLLAYWLLGDGVDRYEYEIEAQNRIGDMLRQIQQQVYEDSQKKKLLLPEPHLQAPNQVLLPK